MALPLVSHREVLFMEGLRSWGEQHGVVAPKLGISADDPRTWAVTQDIQPNGEQRVNA